MEGGASGSDKNISHSQSHEARRGPSPHPKEGSRSGFWEQAPRHRGSRDFLGCGEVVKGAVPGSGPARPPPEQGPDSQHVSTLEELSRTLFVHLKGTEVKLPLRNGGGGLRLAAGRSCHDPTTKSPWDSGLGRRRKHPKYVTGEAAANHSPPRLSQRQDVASAPLLQRRRRAASTRALVQAWGTCSRSRPRSTETSPWPGRVRTKDCADGARASESRRLETRLSATRPQAHPRHTSLAVRPACPAGTWAVGASSVICWKPGFSQKPAEQIGFDRWPPRA